MLKRDLGSDRDDLKYLRREALDRLALGLMGWRTPGRAGKVKLPTTAPQIPPLPRFGAGGRRATLGPPSAETPEGCPEGAVRAGGVALALYPPEQ